MSLLSLFIPEYYDCAGCLKSLPYDVEDEALAFLDTNGAPTVLHKPPWTGTRHAQRFMIPLPLTHPPTDDEVWNLLRLCQVVAPGKKLPDLDPWIRVRVRGQSVELPAHIDLAGIYAHNRTRHGLLVFANRVHFP